MMVHYQRQKSPVTYQHIHTTLANFYNIKRQVEPQWKHPQWRKNTLAYLYHYLVADPITHWSEVISIFALAIHKRRTFATQIIDLLGSDDIRDELSHEQNHIVLLFKQQLNAIKEQGIVAGFAMFDRLCSMQELDEQAQGYALAYRGMCHRMKDKPEQALIDLDKALSFITNDAWIIAHRGLVYEKQDNYPEALKNFDQAIDLDNKNIWIIVNRGYLHQTMGHYTEALADFNQAIALNERDGHAFAHRGAVYNNMGLYQEALADFNLAVALGYNDIWVLGQRAEIYGGLGRYEEALTDFTRIIALDPKNSHAFSHRGVAYSYLKRYEEASADFAQSILLKKKSNCAFIHRAEMHIQRGHYKDALTSLEEAIASDAIDFEDIANTIGLLLSYLGRYEDATAVYQRELQEDPDGFRALYNLAVSMVRWKGVHDSQSCIEKARVRLQQVLNTSARGNALYGLGGLDALTGNVDPALDYLEQALTLEEDAVDWASRDVAWLDLRTHPRFQSLIGSSRTNSVES
jgi:tetratricopeptide (TPR) repeat protein